MPYTTEMYLLNTILYDEAERRRIFPVTEKCVYMAHAGVSPLPRAAVEPMERFLADSQRRNQESRWAMDRLADARRNAARLIGAQPEEIALLGPTSLGLSLVAQGLPWEAGDEVVYYGDDYPANVYPWTALTHHGVRPIALRPRVPGYVTWEAVEAALSSKTRLVALASCNFLTGCRIDVSGIGRQLRERGIWFSLDGIQTVGAFPTPVEYVDFLSADSHKWMLGPVSAGIFYVRKALHEVLRPTLLGAWNIHSPGYVAQENPRFYVGARRYEPGTMNLIGIAGMNGSLELLLDIGIDAVSKRLHELRRALLDGLRPLGYRHCLDDQDVTTNFGDDVLSAITTVNHSDRDMKAEVVRLADNGITASFRENRAGRKFIRFAPHFYNTLDDVDRVVSVLSKTS